MPIIQLEQGTQKWLDFRKNHITSTDASSIMGENPWRNEVELWEEKIGIREGVIENEAMKRGKELEPVARQIFIDRYFPDFEFEPVVFKNDDHKWMVTSLDGICIDQQLLIEIKCPSQKNHDLAKHGLVQPAYNCQMQHHLACTGYNQCWYVSYRPEDVSMDMVAMLVTRDEEFIEKLIIKEQEFYRKLCEFEEPSTWKFNNI